MIAISKMEREKRYKRHCIFSLMKYIPQTTAYLSCDPAHLNSWPCGGDQLMSECYRHGQGSRFSPSSVDLILTMADRLLAQKLVVVVRCKGKQIETVLNKRIKGAPSSAFRKQLPVFTH